MTTASYQPSSSRTKTYREKIEGRLEAAKVNGGAAAVEPRGNGRFTVEGRAGARYTVWALNAETFLCDWQGWDDERNAVLARRGRVPANRRRSAGRAGGGVMSTTKWPFAAHTHAKGNVAAAMRYLEAAKYDDREAGAALRVMRTRARRHPTAVRFEMQRAFVAFIDDVAA